jgi:hypothetical protein
MHRIAAPLTEFRTICGLQAVADRPIAKDGVEWTISADADWPERHGMRACSVCYGPPYIGLLKGTSNVRK